VCRKADEFPVPVTAALIGRLMAIRENGWVSEKRPPDHRGVQGEGRTRKTARLPFRLRRSRRKSVAERLQAVVTRMISKILRDLFQGPDTGPITGTDG
jgi:hypothetical protein